MNNQIFAALIAVFGIAACTTIDVAQTKGDEKITGSIKAGLQSHVAEIGLNGKLYRGNWIAGEPTREQIAQTSYPHRKHLSEVSLDMTAEDGSKMSCKGLAHGLEGDLVCTANGKDYSVALK